MNNKICNNCKREFPKHLIHIITSNKGDTECCPICALKIRNEIHGLPEDTPFEGEMARNYYEEAMEFLKKKERGSSHEPI